MDDLSLGSAWDTLLETAMKAGVGALEYWQMTPLEVYAAVRAANWRMKDRRDQDLWLIWHLAAMERMKEMPTLNDLMHPIREKTEALSADEAAERKAEFERAVAALPKRFKNEQLDWAAGTRNEG